MMIEPITRSPSARYPATADGAFTYETIFKKLCLDIVSLCDMYQGVAFDWKTLEESYEEDTPQANSNLESVMKDRGRKYEQALAKRTSTGIIRRIKTKHRVVSVYGDPSTAP